MKNVEDKLSLMVIITHGISLISFITSSVWGILNNSGSIFGPLAFLIVAIVSYIYYFIYAVRLKLYQMFGKKEVQRDNREISKTFGFVHEPVDKKESKNDIDNKK